jgi:hypothetical protein
MKCEMMADACDDLEDMMDHQAEIDAIMMEAMSDGQ